MARYAPKEWKSVAIMMRESTYKVLEALSKGARTWTQLKDYSGLTDGGIQKVVKELVNRGIVEEQLFKKKDSNLKEKRYTLSKRAEEEKIYEKAKALRDALERLDVKIQ